MQKSFGSFFMKDSVFKASVLLGSVLWLTNAGFNFAAKDYRAFCINVLYVVCLVTVYRSFCRKETAVLQGMIGGLMMISVVGNVNVMAEMLTTPVPSRTLWQMVVGSVLTVGLFINHFMISRPKTKTLWRIKINHLIIILLLLLRFFQVIMNFAAGGFTVLTIEITVGLLAIIPTLSAIICIESKTDTYNTLPG